MQSRQAIFERVREHEQMTEKFHQVEVKLLSTLDFRSFFETVLCEIQKAFDIPYVWFTLLKGTEIHDLACQSGGLRGLRSHLVQVDRTIFDHHISNEQAPTLMNQDLDHFRPLFPKVDNFRLGSMALIPISVDGTLIGSLHQGDIDPNRYRPGLSTIFLERLTTKLSLGLSNITAHEKLKFLAYHDPLTQLLNRRVMESILEREMGRAHRYGSTVSAAFIDLDGFKGVNDRYGHDVGDKLLQYIATGLRKMVRTSDVVTRYAGDEFVILLPETTAQNARLLMQRIQQSFASRPLQVEGATLPVHLSAGVASTEETACVSAADLLRQADQALYRIKKNKSVHNLASTDPVQQQPA